MLYSPASPRAELDMTLFWSVVLLLSLGLVMVYSSSIAMAEAEKLSGYRTYYFLMRHSVFLVLGVVVAFITFQIPIALWQKFAPALFIIGGFLLVIVLIPGIGREVNGSRRWISLGLMTMQPSELMKFFAVLYAADYTVRKAAFMHDFKKGFLPMLSVMVFIGAVLLREPDFGALVVITSIAMSILFLGGLNWRVFAGLIVLLAGAFVALIISSPYRLQRIVGFMDPWADAYGKGYQLSHSLIAFGRGEWLGVGLGGSVEKLFYLPEAHTDFLLAVVAEELGFAGVAAVLILFVLLIYRAFMVGRESMMREKYFAALVAQGIAVWLSVQAFINMGVNMGLLPTKGLTLPFLSYGGTGIIVNCVAVAVLLRIDAETRTAAVEQGIAAGMNAMKRTALIMAAGTGGHIYPGLAIAEVLVQRGWSIVWLATPAGMEHQLVSRVSFSDKIAIEVVQMSGVRSKGLLAWALLPLVLLRAFWQALGVIRRVKPDVVISMGGYVAFPGGMMGVLCGKPLVVHEPGAHAGLTNRVLALIADRVLVGFPKTFEQVPKNPLAKLLPKPKQVEWLGTPVRSAIAELPEPSVRMAGRDGPIRLLIVGGSLGAKTMNELVLRMLEILPHGERPQVVHQSGESHFDELMLAYREAKVAAEVMPFIDDMAKKYAWCDLILCRSGAITVAEIAAAGLASILVPLPYFVAEEQEANARFLADANAGILVKQLETTPYMLAEQLKQLTRRKLLSMATIARTLGKPDATARCARVCMELAA